MAQCSRRGFLRAAGLAGAAAFAGRARAVTPCRPNFLFILADDLSPFSLGAYGNAVCRTPHLDRLAAEGMTVDGAHIMGSWSGAVCTPSRTMLMTGRGLWHIPGQGNPHAKDPALVPPNMPEHSLPAVFNRAGYDTFRTCKEGNSYPAANALFKTRHERTCRDDAGDCGSAWHADRVLEHLDRRRTEGARDPFLIYLGFSFPHDPRNANPERLARYGAVNDLAPDAPVNPAAPPLPANYLPEHPFPHGHPKLRDEEQVQGVMRSRAEAVVRNETGREYACIEEMDAQIGRVLDRLRETGELESTYVVFTADNGIAVGRHGLMGKQNLYEHSWRVPFIARGPGIAPGSRAAGNLYLMDLLPTFCDLASVAAPATCEGVSFRAVLEGRADTAREVLYGAYCGGTKPGMRCVKRGDWKLVTYDVLDGSVRRTQLFNLRENPLELLEEHHAEAVAALTGFRPAPHQRNLADDPAHAETRASLEALLLAEQARLDDPHRPQG